MPGSAALHKEEDIKLEPDLLCYNYCDYNEPQSDPSHSYGDGSEDVKIKERDAKSKIVSNRPEKANSTGPSYQNESSDSVSRKLLDQFKNAFNTKYIDLFHATFVTTISLNTTIHSINQINLSSFMRNPSLFPIATKWELEQSCTVHGNAIQICENKMEEQKKSHFDENLSLW